MAKKISFVIPVFRSEGTLDPTYEQLSALFQNELKGYEYEIVFVDDGSDDNSLTKLLAIHEKDASVKIIKLSRNFGQRPAVFCGFKHATGDAVVKMSSDLQDPVDMIPEFVQGWEEGNEIVLAYRKERQDSFKDSLFSNIFYGLLKLSNPKYPKGGFDYFLLDRKALQHINQMNYRNRFLQGDVLWVGFKIKYLPYKRLKRTIGKSQQKFSTRIFYFISGIIDASYLPIRVMSFLGILTSFLGFIGVILAIYNRFAQENPYPGWASLIVVNLIIGGLIMFMFGVIGEYLWRIHDEIRDKPLYIVDKKYGDI